jgi:hypothetical protein
MREKEKDREGKSERAREENGDREGKKSKRK